MDTGNDDLRRPIGGRFLPQLSSSAATTSALRRARVARSRKVWGQAHPVQVELAWSARGPLAAESAAARVELEAKPRASGQPTWTCRREPDWHWEEALYAAACEEVVLTAQLGDDLDAKHLVLSLAERLTQELAATKPLIRVRFLPTPGPGI